MMDREIGKGFGRACTRCELLFSMTGPVDSLLPHNIAGVSDVAVSVVECGFSYPYSIKDEYLNFQVKDALAGVQNLHEMAGRLIKVLRKVSAEMQLQTIGVVIGGLNAATPKEIAQNRARLSRFSKVIGRELKNGLVFSIPDVCDAALMDAIIAGDIPQAAWLACWKNIVGTGLITDLFVIPRWEKSPRAVAEYKMALAWGLKVHALGFEA